MSVPVHFSDPVQTSPGKWRGRAVHDNRKTFTAVGHVRGIEYWQVLRAVARQRPIAGQPERPRGRRGAAAAALATALALAVCAGALWAVDPDTTLKVQVDGIVMSGRGAGEVSIAVYDEDGFLRRPLASSRNQATGTTLIAELTLDPGVYCVSAFQDSNGNGRLDRNFVGIPKEAVGFSNGYTPKFGPPRFPGCRFEHRGGGEVRVLLAKP